MDKKIIELNGVGLSVREIAKQTGKSTTYVTKIILKSDVKNFLEEMEAKLLDNERIFAVCKKTGSELADYRNKSGIILEHVQINFPEFKIESKYKRKSIEMKTGKFWYHDLFDFVVKKVGYRKCRICNWSTIDEDNQSGCYTVHLKEYHSIGIEKYLEIYPDDSFLFKTFVEKMELKRRVETSKEHGIQCGVCKQFMRKITNKHLKKHSMTISEYKSKFGKTISDFSSKLISLAASESNKKAIPKKKNTWIERVLSGKMSEVGLSFIPQYEKNGFYFDFFFPDYSSFLEADGIFWHGHDRSEKWYLNQFNNVVNDYRKSFGIEKLYRLVEGKSINISNLNQVSSIDSFFNFMIKEDCPIKEHPLFNLKEDTIIFDKEYCRGKSDVFLNEKVDQNLLLVMNEFYTPEKYENFINQNCRMTIESKIKAIFFEPFYEAHKIGNNGLRKTFSAGNNLLKTIQYRLGMNKSQELFDVSIKNIYRGIEVRTMFNVGIFPVNQAREIYGKYVGQNQIVFDPFSGWASRMLAASESIRLKPFTYIGFDSNESLEGCYRKVVEEFASDIGNRVQLHIRDSRNFETSLKSRVDFIFTSPPFYNDEIYTEGQKLYESEKEWIDELIVPVFRNCHAYMRSGAFLLIDMKAKYSEFIISAIGGLEFEFKGKEQYKVTKSHYSKQDKFQEVLIFRKR